MKSMSITRQFLVLILAFAVAMPATVGGLWYILYRNEAAARTISLTGNLQTSAFFALVASVGQVQGTIQRMVREKDPENIEKLLDQCKSATQAAAQRTRESGAAQGDLEASFNVLTASNAKAVELLLHGEIAPAQQVLIEESNPAFERLLAAIGKAQEAASRTEDVVVAAAAASNNRAQFEVLVVVGVAMLGLIGLAFLIVRRITARVGLSVDELTAASDGTASAAS